MEFKELLNGKRVISIQRLQEKKEYNMKQPNPPWLPCEELCTLVTVAVAVTDERP